MKDEIMGGLRNAVERGSSLEQAMKSFINAGYNPAEVRAAASVLYQGATTIMNAPVAAPPSQPQSQSQPQMPPQQIQQQSQSQESQIQQTAPLQPQRIFQSNQPLARSHKKRAIIILLIIFIFLLALFILAMIFGEKILDFLFKK